MDCGTFLEMLDNYANLTKDEMLMLEEHAASCESCGKELEFFRSVINVTASLPELDPPADMLERINAELDGQAKPLLLLNRVYYNVRTHVKQYSTVAACLLVGLIVGLNNSSISNMLHHEPTKHNTDTEPVARETHKPDGIDAPVSPNENEVKHDQAVPFIKEAAVPAFPSQLPVQSKLPDKKNTEAVAAASEINPAASGFSSSYPVKREAVNSSPKASSSGNSVAASTVSPKTQKAAGVPAYKNLPLPTAEVPSGTQYQPSDYTEEPIQDELPANEATEAPSIENYTIARNTYSIQEDEYAYTEPESTPDAVIDVNDYEISTESVQVAMADTSSKNTVYDKLFIIQGDISTVFEIIGNYNVSYVDSHYEASLSEFQDFLSSLDDAGIYYSYTCMRGEEDVVWFKISK